MDEPQFKTFAERAKDLWERMAKYRSAYAEGNAKAAKWAEALKWLTVICGMVTGISSLTLLVGQITSTALTGIAGVFTGTLGLADKVFRWEEKSNEMWKRSKQLEDLQSDLYQYALIVRASQETDDPVFHLDQLTKKISEITSYRAGAIEDYEDRARASLEKHPINTLEWLAVEEAIDVDKEGLPDDAAGVTAVTRGPALGD